MKFKFPLIILTICLMIGCESTKQLDLWTANDEIFETQKIFQSERFPNIVVAKDGSLVALWGSTKVICRRSIDGGKTWGEEVVIADPGFHGGGLTVDDNTGHLFAFVEAGHPPTPIRIFVSKDNGKTWSKQATKISPDKHGNMPAMHMNEHGITLKNSKYAGRIIRPARYYGKTNDRSEWPKHYTNAIYSDNHGESWKTSDPFPANGTGEAAIVELADGTIYYNSRRHLSTDGLNPKMRHIAWSKDGGDSWIDLSVSNELPDGDQNRDYGLMAGLTRIPLKDHDILLFSNIISEKGRKNGHVWMSFDAGNSWPVKKLIEKGSFAYSSMIAGREGTAIKGFLKFSLFNRDAIIYTQIE
jgi:sialidase-1